VTIVYSYVTGATTSKKEKEVEEKEEQMSR